MTTRVDLGASGALKLLPHLSEQPKSHDNAGNCTSYVSLRTLRAFDGGTSPFFKLGVRLGAPDQGSRVNGGLSSQINGAGKFTFGPDHSFGAVFGFSRQRTADADNFGAVGGYVQATGADGKPYDQIAGNTFADSAFDKTVVNSAYFGKLEARVEDKLYTFVSANILDENREMYLQRSGPYIANASGRTITSTGPGTASFGNAQGQVREYDYEMKRKGKVFGAGVDYRVFDQASLSLRAG